MRRWRTMSLIFWRPYIQTNGSTANLKIINRKSATVENSGNVGIQNAAGNVLGRRSLLEKIDTFPHTKGQKQSIIWFSPFSPPWHVPCVSQSTICCILSWTELPGPACPPTWILGSGFFDRRIIKHRESIGKYVVAWNNPDIWSRFLLPSWAILTSKHVHLLSCAVWRSHQATNACRS